MDLAVPFQESVGCSTRILDRSEVFPRSSALVAFVLVAFALVAFVLVAFALVAFALVGLMA